MAEYLKTECAHCGVHIEFPAELFGTEYECPHCHAQTLLSRTEEAAADEPAEQPPPIPPHSQPAGQATAVPQPQIQSRHGPFYYSLIVTLGVVVVLSVIWSAFQAGLVGWNPRAVPLPPLNDEQKAYVEQLFATGTLQTNYDSIDDIWWVSPDEASYVKRPAVPEHDSWDDPDSITKKWHAFLLDGFERACPLQLGYERIGKKGKLSPYVMVHYSGEETISMNNLKCRVGGRLWEVPLRSRSPSVDVAAYGVSVLQLASFPASDQKGLVDALLASTAPVTVRLEGHEKHSDRILRIEYIRMMQDVFLAYRYYGGEW